MSSGSVLWNADSSLQWGPLDDVVMGGVSKTNLVPGDFRGVFTGYVSEENNGGFAGIRTKLTAPMDCSDCSKFKLRVKGDGQRFKFIARDTNEWNGVAWSTSFDTDTDMWTDVTIKISELKPTKFARIVEDSPPFNKANLRGLQLTLSKFEYEGSLNPKFVPGSFRLEVESITVE
jgi:hypothetical protein